MIKGSHTLHIILSQSRIVFSTFWIMKSTILLLLAIVASQKVVLASPTHAECSAALYKGLANGFRIMEGQVPKLIKEGKLEKDVRPTCEFMQMMAGTVLSGFHDSKCKIGLDGLSTTLFEQRLSSLIGGLIEEDCEIIGAETEDDSVGLIYKPIYCTICFTVYSTCNECICL